MFPLRVENRNCKRFSTRRANSKLLNVPHTIISHLNTFQAVGNSTSLPSLCFPVINCILSLSLFLFPFPHWHENQIRNSLTPQTEEHQNNISVNDFMLAICSLSCYYLSVISHNYCFGLEFYSVCLFYFLNFMCLFIYLLIYLICCKSQQTTQFTVLHHTNIWGIF